jgi:hypothetical protein
MGLKLMLLMMAILMSGAAFSLLPQQEATETAVVVVAISLIPYFISFLLSFTWGATKVAGKTVALPFTAAGKGATDFASIISKIIAFIVKLISEQTGLSKEQITEKAADVAKGVAAETGIEIPGAYRSRRRRRNPHMR